MKILCTSDWQASFHNLDTCDKVVCEILAACKDQGIKHVVHAGDVKDPFNPVDVRVVNWIVDVGHRFKKAGIQLYANLGNHDKVGMADSTDDWFPVLDAAGIRTVRSPEAIKVGNVRLFMLPYSRDNDKLRYQLNQFAQSATADDSILIFHFELNGCKHNQLTKSTNKEAVGIKDLHRKDYMFCLGGHIHLHQQLSKNVYYIGSPFAYDMGECNQVKGNVIVDTKRRTLQFIRTSLPGIYDPLWPGFKESRPKSWKGAHVRIHVPCDKSVTNLGQFLEQAEKRAAKDYPGASILVEPEFIDEKARDFVADGTDDRELIAAYVSKHCIANLSDQKPAVVSYLTHKLERAGYLRRASGRLTFLRGYGTNFLSYKKLKVAYNHPGILLVMGRNEDWPGKSNGSGKTSYLQPPAVALFGKTLKGQEHDRWARRNCRDKAVAGLKFQLSNGKLCKVVRTRRPTGLQVFVDGQDVSTGRGTRDSQKLIEQLTGLTWDVLINSIYISQAEVTKILTGTDAERKNIFAQFLGLERFKLARDLINKDIKRCIELMGEVEEACKSYDEQIWQVQKFMVDLGDPVDTRKLKKEIKALKAEHLKQAKRIIKIRKLLRQAAAADATLQGVRTRRDKYSERAFRARSTAIHAVQQIKKMKHIGRLCPVCTQPVDSAWRTQHIKLLEADIKQADRVKTKCEAKFQHEDRRLREFADAVQEGRHKVQSAQYQMEAISEKLRRLKRELATASRRDTLDRKYRAQREALRKKVRITSAASVYMREEISFYRFCLQTFSNDGLPAFLAYQLCPRLNKAAEHYSALFSEGQIHVRFVQDEEDINVQIINPHGGESMSDQSQGEARIASIIASFALREVTSTCNILILDEPGEGLDASNAKAFAVALREAAKRFGTVMVTTHNAHITAELSGERTITVVKRRGTSRIQAV